MDSNPSYGGLRGLEVRKQRILKTKQMWAKKVGIELILLSGSVVEMQATLELERLKRRGRRANAGR